MPFTFGANTTDNATIISTFGNAGGGIGGLFCGWFYPTTLTAGRYYMSPGAGGVTNNFGIRVGTTTSTLQMASNTATPGLWTATADALAFPSGITVGNWWFIAALCNFVNTPVCQWNVWLGTLETPPTAMTVVQNTAPSGLSGTGSLLIGNGSSGGTVSFQGDIATIVYITSTQGSTGNYLGLRTNGSTSADEAEFVKTMWIDPIWRGQFPQQQQPRETLTNVYMVVDMRTSISALQQGGLTVTRTNPTTTATNSNADQPRWLDPNTNIIMRPVRR